MISYKEANELAQYFKENGFKNREESELCVPCEKIKKDSGTFVVISDDDLFKKYGRRLKVTPIIKRWVFFYLTSKDF